MEKTVKNIEKTEVRRQKYKKNFKKTVKVKS